MTTENVRPHVARACAFPIISSAVWVVSKSRSRSASWRFNRAISACSFVGLPIASPGCFPSNKPASRCLTPLSDLGGIQPIGPQIRATLLSLDRLIVGFQVLQFFGDADHAAAGFVGGTISAHNPIIRHGG